MNKRMLIGLLFLAVIGVAVWLLLSIESPGKTNDGTKIIYGISPYQDTMIPVVAEKMGWYADEALDVELKVLAWGEVMPALATGAIDVAIQNFNSFQATYPNINAQGGDVVFYAPFYIFKGAAIMVDASNFIAYDEMKKTISDETDALRKTILQLKGKTIYVTKGTEMEEIVLLALTKANMTAEDVDIIHAQPEDSLAAFLRSEGDAFSAGVTQHMKAYKEGAVPLVTASDLGLVVVDGLVTTESFAREHPEELQKLVRMWFKTIHTMDQNLDWGAATVIADLNKHGSYTFDVQDYKYTWYYTQLYPKSVQEAIALFLDPQSAYYWKATWDNTNTFLIEKGNIAQAVPYTAFYGEAALPAAATQ